jgi:ABC-type lipoprotein export system ATPase subunit
MSLLELERVSKRRRGSPAQRDVLREVSLELDSGEYVVIWGLRGSGRSTLLSVAAGIEDPDSGAVRFQGTDLAQLRGHALGEGIGYCHKRLRGEGEGILEDVMMGLLARGVPSPQARSRAYGALERAGVQDQALAVPGDLDACGAVRVALARTLALQPRLLVIDEPTTGVELTERDGILLLLRSLANEGIAVLASSMEPTGLSGADRTLALSDGELRGALKPSLGTVVPLHGPERRRATG